MISAKIKLALLLASLPVIAQAGCPFTDYFYINAPKQTRTLITRVNGHISYSQLGDVIFSLGCTAPNGTYDFNPGDLFISIGTDNQNQCTLTIHDGANEMNPTITNVSCNSPALTYTGVSHSYGSYQYTLEFK